MTFESKRLVEAPLRRDQTSLVEAPRHEDLNNEFTEASQGCFMRLLNVHTTDQTSGSRLECEIAWEDERKRRIGSSVGPIPSAITMGSKLMP